MYIQYINYNHYLIFSVTTMMVVTEVVVEEEDITENADHHLIIKIDHAMIGHVHVPIPRVSFKKIVFVYFYLSTLSGNPVIFCLAYFINFVFPLFFLVIFSGFSFIRI